MAVEPTVGPRLYDPVMSVTVSLNLPDDVAAWLTRQQDASAAVADAVRAVVNEEDIRRAKRRQDAAAYVAWRHDHAPGHDALIEASNEASLRGHEW